MVDSFRMLESFHNSQNWADCSPNYVYKIVGNLIKRVCTAAGAITGLAALAYFIKEGTIISQVDADRVYGQMAKEFLPNIMPGLLGLFIAALLAGVMSSCDSFMISSSAFIFKLKVSISS